VISHLVYLDAFLPQDGQSLYATGHASPPPAVENGWLIPPIPRRFDDPVEQAWNDARRVSHPRDCFTEAVSLAKPVEEHEFSLTYIKAMLPAAPSTGPQGFWVFAGRVKNNPRWRYREVDCDHMVPQKKPRELAELLLEVLE
jgi:hypothetical protein